MSKTTAKTYPERMNVYFAPEDAAALRALARRSRQSTSALVRLAVDALLRHPDPFLRPNHDEIIRAVSRQNGRTKAGAA